MATPLNLFPSRVRFVNADGTLTPEAYRALQLVLERTGGTLGDNGVDVFADLADLTGAATLDSSITDTVVQTASFDAFMPDVVQPTGQIGTDITLDATGLIVLNAANAQDAYEQTDAALVSARSTGARNGGDISDQGLGVVRISAGSGSILDNTTPATPSYYSVSWAQTDLDMSLSTGINFVYVNSAGTVTFGTTEPTSATRRQAIYLWRVSVIGGLFSAATSITNPLQQYGQGIADVFEALGLVKTGLTLSAASTDLSLAVAEGAIYQSGANFHIAAEDPNKTTYSLKSPATVRLLTQNNTQGSDVTQLDVTNYDLSGTVTAIPGTTSRAQIWTVLQFPSQGGEIRILYGQSYYSSIANAQAALANGSYVAIIPSQKAGSITLGWVITAANATDLSDGVQVFVNANRFGLSGGAISSSGTSYVQLNNPNTLGAAATLDGSAITTVNGFKVPVTAGAVPTADGALAVDSTTHLLKFGSNGSTLTALYSGGALGTPSSGTLTNATDLPAAGVTGTALVAADIGVTVQAYDATYLVDADIGVTVQAYDATYLVDADIGVNVQAYDADLTTWAGVTPGTGVATALAVNTGAAGAFIVNGGAVVTKTADFTLADTETFVINNKASACVVTLPAASSWPGRAVTFQNYQAFTLTSLSSNVVPQGGGSAGTAILLGVVGNWATLVSDSTNWVIMQAAPNNILLLE